MADINIVLEGYHDQFYKVKEQLSNRLKRLPEDTQDAVNTISQFIPRAIQSLQSVVETIQIYGSDFSPIGDEHELFKALSDMYMWASVCQLLSLVAFIIGREILFPFVNLFFGEFCLASLSLLVIPVFIYQYLRKNEMEEIWRYATILIATVFYGFMVGFVTRNYYLDFVPPPKYFAFLSIGLTATWSSTELREKHRSLYLFTCIGSLFVCYGLFGWIIGSLCYPFVVWSLIYCTFIALDLQVKIGHSWNEGLGIYSEQMISNGLLNMTSVSLGWMFSVPHSDQA